jgi:hypothetical protein
MVDIDELRNLTVMDEVLQTAVLGIRARQIMGRG